MPLCSAVVCFVFFVICILIQIEEKSAEHATACLYINDIDKVLSGKKKWDPKKKASFGNIINLWHTCTILSTAKLNFWGSKQHPLIES